MILGSLPLSLSPLSSSSFFLPLAFASVAIAYPRCSKRAFNRWMVAYTLLKNPSLQQLTASKLKESASVSDVPQTYSLNYPDNFEKIQ